MQQKLITFAVPCYNSAAYMRHCIETLLSAGEQAEIILVDDGSVKDDTPAICDEYAATYPTIVKAIHQENGGHGEGVNQGIRNATGLYQRPHLIFHQADQRRHHDGDARQQQRRHLIADGLSRAGGHHGQYILPVQQPPDDLLLPGAEAVVAKYFF